MGLQYKGIQLTGKALEEAKSLGYYITPVETFKDWNNTNNISSPCQIDRVIVEDSVYLTTFTNIIDELDTVFQQECNDKYDTENNTVSVWVDLSEISLIIHNKYGNDEPCFDCKHKMYIKIE